MRGHCPGQRQRSWLPPGAQAPRDLGLEFTAAIPALSARCGSTAGACAAAHSWFYVGLRFQPHSPSEVCLPPPRPNPHRQCRPRAVDCGRSRRHVKRSAGNRRLCQPCAGRRWAQHQVRVAACTQRANRHSAAAPVCAAPVCVPSTAGFSHLSELPEALRPAVQGRDGGGAAVHVVQPGPCPRWGPGRQLLW